MLLTGNGASVRTQKVVEERFGKQQSTKIERKEQRVLERENGIFQSVRQPSEC